jgi:hypothetical protein
MVVCFAHPANADCPVIELPDVIDLGTRDPGPAHVRFAVGNRGDKSLELSDIRTGCGCMSVQIAGSAQAGSITRLSVPPHASRDLILMVSLRAGEQSDFRTDITFATNDPQRPQVSLPCVGLVAGSITASPTHWLVGNVTPADRLKTSVEVRDTGRIAPCTIDRVTTSHPAVVRASLKDRPTPVADSSPQPPGRLLAVAELELMPPGEPGEISVTVSFFESGRESPVVTVPVSGRVPARVTVVPAAVVLPRQTGSGPIDEMTVIVQSSGGEPFELAAKGTGESPPQLTVRKESISTFTVTIRWPERNRPAPGGTSRQSVTLTASFADAKTDVTIPVLYRTPGTLAAERPQ